MTDNTTVSDSDRPIVLHQFPLVWERNLSPFALKLEAWMRLAGVAFDIRGEKDPRKAPMGKLPYITDGKLTVADSSLIISHLKTRCGLDPDDWLTARQRGEAVALQRLLEEHFYFALMYSRWIDPRGWRVVKPAFFEGLPPGLRQILPHVIRRQLKRVLHEQGLGRHDQATIYAMGRDDLEAIDALLDNKPFFMGDQPSTIDTVAYGFLANLLLVPIDTELKRIGAGFPRLQNWCLTMEQSLKATARVDYTAPA